tara:strand:+ start:358 stop:795 length:438 start_codon:yes stop_codon:yes gene_type:complete
MTEQVQLACTVTSLDPTAAVGLEIWLDDTQIYNTEHVDKTVDFAHEFEDTDGNHQLRFVMKNKTSEHTTIDKAGNILKDCRICINNLSFDLIELGQIFIDQAVYEHNFNGTADTIQDKFYGEMGCNGTVTLAFTTPVYLWLLENM